MYAVKYYMTCISIMCLIFKTVKYSIVNEVFKRKLKLHLLEVQKSGEQQH